MDIVYAVLLAILVVVSLFFLYWRVWFLRDPERVAPEGKNIVSPADGRVIEVLEVSGKMSFTVYKRFMGKIRTMCSDVSRECYLISIFMSPLDVHINRCPIAGKVLSIKHKAGSLKSVTTLGAGLQNEKSEMLLETPIGKVKVIQVAGMLARMIVNNTKPGINLEKGERYGLINLGSQLIVILPKKKTKIAVSKGEKVKAGQTVIAYY